VGGEVLVRVLETSEVQTREKIDELEPSPPPSSLQRLFSSSPPTAFRRRKDH